MYSRLLASAHLSFFYSFSSFRGELGVDANPLLFLLQFFPLEQPPFSRSKIDFLSFFFLRFQKLHIYRKRDRERLESFKILKTLRKRFWKWMKQEWRGMQCRQRKGDAFGGGRARKVGRGGSRGTRFEKISSQLPMAMLINLGAISSSPGRTPRHEIQFSSAWNSERSSQRGTRSRGPIGS